MNNSVYLPLRDWRQVVTTLGIILIIALVGTASVYAQAEESETAADTTGYFAPYHGEDTASAIDDVQEVTFADNEEQAAMAFCRYSVIVDDPHPSRGEVSAHGAWDVRSKNRDRCPLYAHISVWLEGHWCNSHGSCYWRLLDYDEDRILYGGGRGRRVTVRHRCTKTPGKITTYRNTVRVNPEGRLNFPKTAMRIENLECKPH